METPSARVSALAAVAAVAALAALHPSVAAARRAPCAAPQGQHTAVIAADRRAQVYMSGSRYYGCYLATRRRVLLGRTYSRTTPVGENHYLHGFKLAGRFVAFVDDLSRDPALHVQSPRLVDLRSGRIVQAPDLVRSPTGSVVQSVTATARGTLVWVGDGRAGECGGLSLHSAGPAASDDRTLDCGPVADVSVLGGRVYWMRDAQPRTALVT